MRYRLGGLIFGGAYTWMGLFSVSLSVSPVLIKLYWLPVVDVEVVNGMAPVYLQDLLDLYRPCRNLRSGNMLLLKTQSYNLKLYGFRAFSIILCAP